MPAARKKRAPSRKSPAKKKIVDAGKRPAGSKSATGKKRATASKKSGGTKRSSVASAPRKGDRPSDKAWRELLEKAIEKDEPSD